MMATLVQPKLVAIRFIIIQSCVLTECILIDAYYIDTTGRHTLRFPKISQLEVKMDSWLQSQPGNRISPYREPQPCLVFSQDPGSISWHEDTVFRGFSWP